VNPVWFAVVALLAGGAIAAGYFVFSRASDPYRTMQSLSVPAYLDNANSLRGNTYRVGGTVWDSLGWSPAAGRMYAIEVGEAKPTDPLPILVPAALNHVNLQKGQRFVFQVEVGEGGILIVRDLKKW
jgi:hypothetical protein